MNLNTILHYLVEKKLGWKESTVFRDGDKFTITSNNNEIVTEKDFTKNEISAAKTELEAIIHAEQQVNLQKKTELLQRLGITEDEAKLLLG